MSTKGRVVAGFCSSQSSTQSLTNQLIEWVQSGVLLLGWNENQQLYSPLSNSLDIPNVKSIIWLD